MAPDPRLVTVPRCNWAASVSERLMGIRHVPQKDGHGEPARFETVVYPVAMPIETKQMDSGVAVVTVAGRLVLGKDVERLETVINELLKQDQKKFVFDISSLDYADSSGIGTLVACLTHIKKAGGDLRMAGANARMLRLFQMTGVNSLMSLYPTVAAAEAG